MIICIIAVLAIAFIIYGIWCNKALELNTYTIGSDRLPEPFDGYRIVHISDLHNTEMGKANEKLLTMISSAEPDMIAITGDIIDSRRTDTEAALNFVKEAVKIAPCYYVTGNHEQRIAEYEDLKTDMKESGVIVLENEKELIKLDDSAIILAGVDDPMFTMDPTTQEPDMVMEAVLDELLDDSDGYTILLSHRPELFDVYVQKGTDIVLSGHAHGGQIKLPLAGGIISPGEGFFPKYYEGVYEKKRTQMVVSRGIGNSLFPLRINNRPELGVVILENSND